MPFGLTLDMIIDIAVIILIGMMIIYCVRLNRKLSEFRNAQREMASMVGQLNEATEKAQMSIVNLNRAAQAQEGRLNEQLSKARALSDELSLITETGENLANRIERGLTSASTVSSVKSHSGPEIAEKTDIKEDIKPEQGDADMDDDQSQILETLKKVR